MTQFTDHILQMNAAASNKLQHEFAERAANEWIYTGNIPSPPIRLFGHENILLNWPRWRAMIKRSILPPE